MLCCVAHMFETMRDLLLKIPGLSNLELIAHSGFNRTTQYIDSQLSGYHAWQVVAITLIVVMLVRWLYDYWFHGIGGIAKTRNGIFRLLRSIPYVKRQVEAEISKTAHSIQESFAADLKPGMRFQTHLPVKRRSKEEVYELAKEYKSMCKCDLNRGRASGTVYNGGAELTELNAKVYGMFAWTNPLHGDIFPDIRKMEAEVVQMCVNMFHGGPDACGTMTAGGTESIMLACKAYRDRAISRGIKYPEMLIGRSAHAAFEKACQSFGIVLRCVPADPVTMKLDVNKMRRMINRNTCMLVGSCPDFPNGVIDPIEEIAKLGLRYDIPVHVDACLGGFLVAFMEKAGYHLPPFDFRVDGVTSISCDTHKYGFAPKGSSVILYSTRELRRYQYYVITDWPGGIYATPTLGGSRPGAIIAACWATMMYYGEEGYIDTTRKIIETARYIKDRLKEIEGIFIYGEPLVSVFSIGSLDFDIYRLSSSLTHKGWSLNALQFPSSFHLCCTLLHTQPGIADEFISDVRECVAQIMLDPKEKATGMAAVYGMSQTIPDRSLVGEIVMEYIDALYDTNALPKTNGFTAHN